MKLDDFAYSIPEELIAQRPLAQRDQARLLVVDRKTQTFHHDIFANIAHFLPRSSCIVLNDSKVIPARLLGRKSSGGQVEIFLLKKQAARDYETLMRPLRRMKAGDVIHFNGNHIKAQVIDPQKRIVRFNRLNILRDLDRIGHMPLPPYIKRPDEKSDRIDYQTVYAKNLGSVASPTAGLHFTKLLLSKLKKSGSTLAYVTLHVNYATFKPVEATDIREHQMHIEEYEVSPQTFKQVNEAKAQGHPIVAVGTTSCRVLETIAGRPQRKGATNLFIYPGYQFQMTDVLITNFHQPFTTLLMLVYAFGGKDLVKKAYAEAISKKYRFYSYGDCMMIV